MAIKINQASRSWMCKDLKPAECGLEFQFYHLRAAEPWTSFSSVVREEQWKVVGVRLLSTV